MSQVKKVYKRMEEGEEDGTRKRGRSHRGCGVVASMEACHVTRRTKKKPVPCDWAVIWHIRSGMACVSSGGFIERGREDWGGGGVARLTLTFFSRFRVSSWNVGRNRRFPIQPSVPYSIVLVGILVFLSGMCDVCRLFVVSMYIYLGTVQCS